MKDSVVPRMAPRPSVPVALRLLLIVALACFSGTSSAEVRTSADLTSADLTSAGLTSAEPAILGAEDSGLPGDVESTKATSKVSGQSLNHGSQALHSSATFAVAIDSSLFQGERFAWPESANAAPCASRQRHVQVRRFWLLGRQSQGPPLRVTA